MRLAPTLLTWQPGTFLAVGIWMCPCSAAAPSAGWHQHSSVLTQPEPALGWQHTLQLLCLQPASAQTLSRACSMSVSPGGYVGWVYFCTPLSQPSSGLWQAVPIPFPAAEHSSPPPPPQQGCAHTSTQARSSAGSCADACSSLVPGREGSARQRAAAVSS